MIDDNHSNINDSNETLRDQIVTKPNSRFWIRWSVLGLLIILLGGLIYQLLQKQPNKLLGNNKSDNSTISKGEQKGKGGSTAVTVVASKIQNISLSQTLPATIVPLQQVIIRPTQAGQIAGIFFKDGQYVKKGQLLAKLDDRLIQTSVANAKAVLNQNQVQLATNLQTQQRYQSLLKDNAVSQQEVAQIVGQTNLIQAQAATSETQLQAAQVQLANTEIRAPFAGVVGVHKATVGAMVSTTDTNGIVTLTQVNPIAVSFGIPNSLLANHSAIGLPIEVWSMADDAKLLGTTKITAVDGQIDNNGNLPVQASINNSAQQFTANQPVKVKLITKQYQNVVTVPLAAVKNGISGQYVMTVQPSNEPNKQIAKRQDVQVIDQNDDIAIVDNIAEGLMVIIDGNNKVRDGSTVKPVIADQQRQNVNGKNGNHKHKNKGKTENQDSNDVAKNTTASATTTGAN